MVVLGLLAAAAGRADWTDWGGNAVIISHDVGGKKDVYRTIYKHLKNGSQNDCSKMLTQSMPSISDQDKIDKMNAFLDFTGCIQVGNIPDETYWGKTTETMEVTVGQEVNRGDSLGWAGNTGPGGIILSINDDLDKIEDTGRNIHLHIYFAKRDSIDQKWYLIDPYGIYSKRDCYPTDLDDPINTPCSRYQVFWKDGIAKYPQPLDWY